MCLGELSQEERRQEGDMRTYLGLLLEFLDAWYTSTSHQDSVHWDSRSYVKWSSDRRARFAYVAW